MEPSESQFLREYKEARIKTVPSESQFLRDLAKVLSQKEEITFQEWHSLGVKFAVESLNEFLDDLYSLADRYSEEDLLQKYKLRLPQIKNMLRARIMLAGNLMPVLINVFRCAFLYLLEILCYCRIASPQHIKLMSSETQELLSKITQTVLYSCCEICTSEIIGLIGPLNLGDSEQPSLTALLNLEKEKIDPSTQEDFREYLNDNTSTQKLS